MRMFGTSHPGARAARWLPAATALAVLALAGPAAAAPPPAPTGLTVTPDGPTQATSVRASWTVPADLPAGTTAHIKLCPLDDIVPPPEWDRCVSSPSDELTGTTIPFPSQGLYDLTVRLESAEGEEGPSTAPRRIAIDRDAPNPPRDIRWEGGTVRWTDPVTMGEISPIVRAHWRFCRGWLGAADTCVTGSSEQRPFALANDLAPLGPPPGYCSGWGWTLSLWLEDAAGNVDAGRRGGIGAGVTPSCVPPPGTPPTKPRATSVVIGKRVGPARGRSAKRQVTITTTVRPADAGGRVRLEVTGRRGTTKLSRTRNVRLERGRATLTVSVPKGFRRLTVRATYAGSTTHGGSNGKLVVRIPRG